MVKSGSVAQLAERSAVNRKVIGSYPIRSVDSGTVLRNCSTWKPVHPLEEMPRPSLTSNGKVWLFWVSKNMTTLFFDGYTVSGSGTVCKTVAFGFGWFDSISIDEITGLIPVVKYSSAGCFARHVSGWSRKQSWKLLAVTGSGVRVPHMSFWYRGVMVSQ